jgi:hypothetical protein
VCLAGTPAPCGAAGQPCCQDSTCTVTGSCCVGGVCLADGEDCAEELGSCEEGACGGFADRCGGDGLPCCAGSPRGEGAANDFCTSPGLACDQASRTCRPCGGSGQPCCEGNLCDDGGCCDWIPWDESRSCVADGDSCAETEGTCSAGACGGGTCGLVGLPCCGRWGGSCTGPYATCDGAACTGCGGLGQTCCPSAVGAWCGAPYVCSRDGDECVECGGRDQPCCQGGVCDPGLHCSAYAGACR